MKLAPRKPDWDLKRDVAKKLEKLERRTQRAIAELIRTLIYHQFSVYDVLIQLSYRIDAKKTVTIVPTHVNLTVIHTSETAEIIIQHSH